MTFFAYLCIFFGIFAVLLVLLDAHDAVPKVRLRKSDIYKPTVEE